MNDKEIEINNEEETNDLEKTADISEIIKELEGEKNE